MYGGINRIYTEGLPAPKLEMYRGEQYSGCISKEFKCINRAAEADGYRAALTCTNPICESLRDEWQHKKLRRDFVLLLRYQKKAAALFSPYTERKFPIFLSVFCLIL